MKTKPEAQDTKTVINIIDEHYEEDLQKTIVGCKAYKDYKAKLPSVETIVYLYVKECLRFVVGDANDGLFYIQEREVSSFIEHLYNKARLDVQVLLLFLGHFQKHMAMFAAKTKIDDDTIAVLKSMLEWVRYNYWESRINGIYDKATDIIQYISAYLLSKSGREDREAFNKYIMASIKDYGYMLSSATKAEIPKILVDNPKDLTIILDYSFDRNKHEASYRLTSGSQSLRLPKLLSPTQLGFLMENIINPLTREKKTYVNPGEIAVIDPITWEGYGNKRTYQIDHINSAIRMHIRSERRLKFFSQKGCNIEVKVNIRIETMPREKLFKR
ncbi:MAG: hypothetical protein PHD87_07000 [Candidatus Cloacimonetes bacterium]|nr:hypothetical protein [Candidatus Cloacimonadota bacterium]